MSRCYWCSIIAAGLVLAVAARAQPVDGDTGTQERPAEAEAQPKPDPYPAALEAIQHQLGRISGALEAQVDKKQPTAEQQRARRDLHAQERMAKWAKFMFWAALASVCLTGVGIFLIWRTLFHTRAAAEAARDMVQEGERATVAAIEATREAKRQADLAERSYLRLERPYLFIKIIDEDPLGARDRYEPPYLIYTIVNYGKTPAVLRATATELTPTNRLMMAGDTGPASDLVAVARYEVIEAGGRLSEALRVKVKGSADNQRFVGRVRSTLVLHGFITYNDATGALHRDWFRLRANEDTGFHVEGGTEHNKRETEYPAEDSTT